MALAGQVQAGLSLAEVLVPGLATRRTSGSRQTEQLDVGWPVCPVKGSGWDAEGVHSDFRIRLQVRNPHIFSHGV